MGVGITSVHSNSAGLLGGRVKIIGLVVWLVVFEVMSVGLGCLSIHLADLGPRECKSI